MKLQFKHQQFQEEAAQCVVKAFAGQPNNSNNAEYIMDMGSRADEVSLKQVGFGNTPLAIQRNDIAANIRPLQTDQNIRSTGELEGEGVQLTIEMETGTGKTYTYIKTMYELNKH